MSSRYVVRQPSVPLAAATPKTVLAVGFPNFPLRTVEIGVSFDGSDATQKPVLVELFSNSAAGTGAGATVLGVQKWTAVQPSTTVTFTASGFTTEPATSSALFFGSWQVTPAGGVLVVTYPTGEGPSASPNNNIGLGLRCTSVTGAAAVNVTPYIVFDEVF